MFTTNISSLKIFLIHNVDTAPNIRPRTIPPIVKLKKRPTADPSEAAFPFMSA